MAAASTQSKTGILLLNMGGPDSLPAVKPFLYNLFSDPDIIKLPFSAVFQKPLAWWISTNREEEAKKNYALMGGKSPILGYTQAQGEALRQALLQEGHGNFKLYVAMRYWHPFTEETVAQIERDGIEHLMVLSMYPHFSYTTTGSSLNELRRVLQRRNSQIPVTVIPPYYDHPTYVQAVAETLQSAMDSKPWSCPPEEIQLLFSAHSLPLKHVKRTKDPYPQQIRETARRVVESYFPHNPWEICYQSQVGNMPWLGPSTEGILHYFSGKRRDNILMAPISFVSDHVETLVEVDQQYLPLAHELEIEHCHRAPALNTNPTFIRLLKELVAEALGRPTENSITVPPLQELIQVPSAG